MFWHLPVGLKILDFFQQVSINAFGPYLSLLPVFVFLLSVSTYYIDYVKYKISGMPVCEKSEWKLLHDINDCLSQNY